MPLLSRLAAATLALLPALAAAQEPRPAPDPLDPAHPVPQLPYQSAFDRYQSSQDEKETPEKRWRAVNQQLMPQGKPGPAPAAGGHDHMQGGH